METKHLRYPKVNEKHVLVTAVLKAAFNKRFYKAFGFCVKRNPTFLICD